MLASSLPGSCQIALKEWAVTVQALAQGRQVLLLRKGGIHEEGKDFRVVHPEFLLYPTYEHQREDLLKPAAQPSLKQLLAETPQSDTITFSHWAQVAEVIECRSRKRLMTCRDTTSGPTLTRSRDCTGSPCCPFQ